MMSFETFKKQFDESLSKKTSEQILNELQESGIELVEYKGRVECSLYGMALEFCSVNPDCKSCEYYCDN